MAGLDETVRQYLVGRRSSAIFKITTRPGYPEQRHKLLLELYGDFVTDYSAILKGVEALFEDETVRKDSARLCAEGDFQSQESFESWILWELKNRGKNGIDPAPLYGTIAAVRTYIEGQNRIIQEMTRHRGNGSGLGRELYFAVARDLFKSHAEFLAYSLEGIGQQAKLHLAVDRTGNAPDNYALIKGISALCLDLERQAIRQDANSIFCVQKLLL